jgi:hypothetical protein
MSRHSAFVVLRSVCFLALLGGVALSGLTATAAPSAVTPANVPIIHCIVGACADPPKCGSACLKNPPPAPAPYATVTDFQAGLPMQWTDAAMDGPCTDPNHFNCIPNVGVLTISFTTTVATRPIVFLGNAAPIDAGSFPQGVGIAIIQVDAQPTTQHSWTIYPAQHAYQIFQETVGKWPPSPQYWDQGWAVIYGYDPNSPNATPIDDKLFS